MGAALADRYAVGAQLGRGGMATVYVAEDLRHQRRVALKVLNPALGARLGATASLLRSGSRPVSSILAVAGEEGCGRVATLVAERAGVRPRPHRRDQRIAVFHRLQTGALSHEFCGILMSRASDDPSAFIT